MALSHSRKKLRSQIGALTRYGAPAAEIAELRRRFLVLSREEVIRSAVESEPIVTDDEAKALIAIIAAAAS